MNCAATLRSSAYACGAARSPPSPPCGAVSSARRSSHGGHRLPFRWLCRRCGNPIHVLANPRSAPRPGRSRSRSRLLDGVGDCRPHQGTMDALAFMAENSWATRAVGSRRESGRSVLEQSGRGRPARCSGITGLHRRWLQDGNPSSLGKVLPACRRPGPAAARRFLCLDTTCPTRCKVEFEPMAGSPALRLPFDARISASTTALCRRVWTGARSAETPADPGRGSFNASSAWIRS